MIYYHAIALLIFGYLLGLTATQLASTPSALYGIKFGLILALAVFRIARMEKTLKAKESR